MLSRTTIRATAPRRASPPRQTATPTSKQCTSTSASGSAARALPPPKRVLTLVHPCCRCGVDPATQLVVYGQSVGSAPSLWLATRTKVAAVVLHTPLLSGLRVLIPPHGGCCTVRRAPIRHACRPAQRRLSSAHPRTPGGRLLLANMRLCSLRPLPQPQADWKRQVPRAAHARHCRHYRRLLSHTQPV